MYKILIIDDEPFIADGLYRTFQNLSEFSLEVYRSYSARIALDLLEKYRMDIVITDINMPGLSGLDILREIQSRWPQCRTIVLSGYNDFDYAQQAMSYGADSYILKTDGDERLLDAVRQCIRKIEASAMDAHWKEKTEAALTKALPLLRQEYLLRFLRREFIAPDELNNAFQELSIPLSPFSPVLVVGIRLDHVREHPMGSTDSYYMASIFELFQEMVHKKLSGLSVLTENSRCCLWFFQPSAQYLQECFQRSISYVNGTLETLQKYIHHNLKVSASFILEPEPVPFEKLPDTCEKLYFILTQKLHATEEMVLGTSNFYADPADTSLFPGLLSSFQLLEQTFMQKNEKKFLAITEKLLNDMINFHYPDIQLLIYHRICGFFLEKLFAISGIQEYLNDFHSMEHFSLPYSKWDISLYDRLLDTARWLLRTENRENNIRYQNLISVIHQYIANHLRENISLSTIAEQVYLNPVYLSRIYKQITGETLSRYISGCRLENARELLKNSSLKINEIASGVGYESAAHFSRVFKKEYGISPQEYRNSK